MEEKEENHKDSILTKIKVIPSNDDDESSKNTDARSDSDPEELTTEEYPDRSPLHQNRLVPDAKDDNPATSGGDSDGQIVDNFQALCRRVAWKLQEKTETINMYQKALFSTQILLVNREAACQKRLRKLLIRNKISTKRDTELDALVIFPEEIWTMILDYVFEPWDLQSCAKMCNPCSRILEPSKTQWLFAKIFPYIFNELERCETLTCRLVCKKWCSGVDNFLENYSSVPSLTRTSSDLEKSEQILELPNVNFKENKFSYTFSIEDKTDYISKLELDVRREMNLHPRNPFVGRTVTLERYDHYDDAVEDHAASSNFVLQSNQFLCDFGKHIQHLRIVRQSRRLDFTHLYRICLQSLVECKRLRSLSVRFHGWRYTDVLENVGRNLTEINELPPPASNPNLEYLKVMAVYNYRCSSFFHFQDKLVETFHAQLKRLEVRYWNDQIYPNYSWSCLLELEIFDVCAETNLASLRRMRAPNLRHLLIRMDEEEECLQTLLEVSNHFPKLDRLILQFPSGCEGDDEVLRLSRGPRFLTAPSSLTTLEVNNYLTELSSYNFLVCFPFLQRLVIRHAEWARDTDTGWFPNRQYGFPGEPGVARYKERHDVINIGQYALLITTTAADLKLIYKSNIWSALPFLRILELCDSACSPERRIVYTRESFENHQKQVVASGSSD